MIREYKSDDADAVVAVWRAANALAHPFLSDAFVAEETHNVRNVYPQFADIWVTEVDGEVIGFIALIDRDIGGLFVTPEHHGQGFGRELVDFAVTQRGPLTVEVFRDNAVGRAFYDRYGFVKTGEYRHEPSGQMTLRMALTPNDA